MKENCLWGRCKKKGKKTNNSTFLATHTYKKLTLVSSFLLFFLCTFPLGHAVQPHVCNLIPKGQNSKSTRAGVSVAQKKVLWTFYLSKAYFLGKQPILFGHC